MNTPGDNAAKEPVNRSPYGAVISWLLLHLLVTFLLVRGVNSLFLLLIYCGMSWLIALPVAAIVGKPSNEKFGLIMLWVIGPLLVYVYAKIGAAHSRHQFEESMAEVRELCDKYGEEKIYRTIENVEGVFQVVGRDPSESAQVDPNAEHPWATAQGDRAEMREYATTQIGYRFFEQQPGYKLNGPPYKRTYLQCYPIAENQETSSGECGLIQVQRSVNRLRSRYGYVIEDRTTPEMRAKWIGGGTMRVIDLETNEVLAERTGFYKAVGGGAMLHWGDARASRDLCKFRFGLWPFLTNVLKPVKALPTAEELNPLAED